jgi:hypothetical protein
LLNDNGASNSFNWTIEHRQKAIASIFDEPPVMLRDGWLDEFTPLTFYTSVCPLFVVPHEAAVTRDVSSEDCGQAARQFVRRPCPISTRPKRVNLAARVLVLVVAHECPLEFVESPFPIVVAWEAYVY